MVLSKFLRRLFFLVAALWLHCCCALGAGAKPAADRCAEDAAYRRLDFWLGDWEVFDSKDGSKSGTNKIEKIVEGCAIVENWRNPDGTEVKGFLYFEPARKAWKYVLISHGGGIKERVMDAAFSASGGVRFQGEIAHVNSAGSHLDRMTLFPLAGHRIRETIEVSRDNGKTWEMVFDAEYWERKKP